MGTVNGQLYLQAFRTQIVLKWTKKWWSFSLRLWTLINEFWSREIFKTFRYCCLWKSKSDLKEKTYSNEKNYIFIHIFSCHRRDTRITIWCKLYLHLYLHLYLSFCLTQNGAYKKFKTTAKILFHQRTFSYTKWMSAITNSIDSIERDEP